MLASGDLAIWPPPITPPQRSIGSFRHQIGRSPDAITTSRVHQIIRLIDRSPDHEINR
jgi:hypothetical protein